MILLLNPIIAMLFNEKRKTWHPILFQEHALPGPYSPDKPIRHKSKGHHTEGFSARADAVKDADKLADTIVSKGMALTVKKYLEEDILWDGEDTPALVNFFPQENSRAAISRN